MCVSSLHFPGGGLRLTQAKSPAVAGFDKLKALEGQWVDADGVFGEKGKVVVTYKVTGPATPSSKPFRSALRRRW